MNAVVLKARFWTFAATGVLFAANHDYAAEAEQKPLATPVVSNELVSSHEVTAWIKKLRDAGLTSLQKGGEAPKAPDDVGDAVEFFTKGAKQGDAWAFLGLGWLYERGWGVPRDQTQAFEFFYKAAVAGNVVGQFNVATGYDGGKGVRQDFLKATTWYRKAAEQGYVYAQMLLGSRYEDGKGVSQDYVEAAKWYRKAADQDDSFSQFQLGLLYATGQGVERNDAESFKWMRKAAEHGTSKAMYNVGQAFRQGLGVTQDHAEAAKWYRQAADRGHDEAQFILALQYADGTGVSQDFVEAAKWYRKAADQGFANGQLNLGNLYANGQGVPRDYVEAAKWYRKAAGKGHASALSNLGVLYANGQGMPQDHAEAAKLYRRAAAQGDDQAQFNLAECYRVGQGVGQDVIEAYAFYNVAAASGHEEARKKRDAVAMVYLKGETLLLAQKRSRELKVELDNEKTRAANPGQAANDNSGGRSAPTANVEPTPSEAKGMGSGFVVAADGLVVTNWHVVEKATRVELVTARGRMSAKVVAADQSNDLVILRAAKPLAVALPIRSSRGTKIGTEVFTIGFPNPDLQGFSPKFNRGEISSVAGAADDPRYFQISVPLQPGNSGGALCDAEGRVVGVVAAKLDERLAFKTSGSLPENVNYAIKSTYLLALVESLDLPQNTLAADTNVPVSSEAARQRAQDSAVLVLVY